MPVDLNQTVPGNIPTWGEILWPNRKQRRAIARLVDECNLLWWWFKALRLAEISDHESILKGMKTVVAEANTDRASRMAKGIAMSKEEFLKGATEKGLERRTYIEIYRLLLSGGLQVSFESLMKHAKPTDGDMQRAWKEHLELATAYAPFLAWNRKLYSFDSKAWELITANPLDLTWRQASTMFEAFPNNTVCIEVPEGVELPGSPQYLIGGAFPNMERNNTEPRLLLVSIPHTREHRDHVETPLSWVFQNSDMMFATEEDNMSDVAPYFLCAVAYLQARPEDRTPRPLKRSKKVRQATGDLELPEPFEVGVRLGQSIRLLEQQRDDVIRENLRTPEGRKRPVPHWRSPHHHVYWTGSDRTTPVIKWIDATIVNKDLGEVGVVQHKVTK